MSKIVIAPFSLHKGLMSLYRKDDVFADVKFITKEELLSDYFGKISGKSIAYLMKLTNRSASACQELCRYIPYILSKDEHNKKLQNLYEYREEFVKNGLLKTNEYLKQYFLNNEVEVFGYDKEDLELNKLLSFLDVSPTYKDENALPKLNDKTIKAFDKTSIEIASMLNDIAMLIDEGIDIKNIYIYAADEIVVFYLKQFSNFFNFRINFEKEERLSNTELAKNFVKEYEKTFNLEEALIWLNDQDDSTKGNLLDIIRDNTFDFLDEKQQFDLIQESLKNWTIKSTYYDNAVKVIKDSIYAENAYIFVPCFAEGIVPKSSKDSGYLNDYEKAKYSINPSTLNNKFDMKKMIHFLSTNNTFYLSFSKENISNKMNVSPISLLFDIKISDFEMPSVFYSKEYAKILGAIAKDKYDYYLKDSVEYQSLKNMFDGISDYDNNCTQLDIYDKSVTLKHSYTSISSYYNCPFQYYLNYVLGVKEVKDAYNLRFGSLTHQIFEDVYKHKVSFEEAYEKARAKIDFDPVEQYLIDLAKPQLKMALDSFKKHELEYMDSHKFFLEENIDIQLQPGLLFNGKIDKLNVLDDEYAVVIDYKSGKESFDSRRLKYGLSMQLPIYALLIKKSEKFNKYDIGGIYISNFFKSSYVDDTKISDKIPSYLKLNGLTYVDNSFDFLSKFDYTYENVDGSSFISGIKMKGSSLASKGTFSKGEMEEYMNLVEEKIVDADIEIKNNNFCINPYYIGDRDNACRYCPYRDICYVRWEQRNNLKEQEEDDA